MKMQSPLQLYQAQVQAQHLQADPLQASLIDQFEQLYQQLQQRVKRGRLQTWLHGKQSIKGLYVWGSVGIGKTHMMDLFYQSLITTRKCRYHFHHFMQLMQQRLHVLQHQKNPIDRIVADFAKEYDLLCLDEFIVDDIADATILAELLNALFKYKIVFVTTSNTLPDKLYWRGLARDNFLPAIALIKQHMQIFHLQSEHDYRLQQHLNLRENNANLLAEFKRLAKYDIKWDDAISINNRSIMTVAHSRHLAWFDFNVLCHAPRHSSDYYELAQRYKVILLNNVPQIAPTQHNSVKYLINLVDTLYDANVKLIISTVGSIDEIYRAGKLHDEFQRTRSRLIEMQG